MENVKIDWLKEIVFSVTLIFVFVTILFIRQYLGSDWMIPMILAYLITIKISK